MRHVLLLCVVLIAGASAHARSKLAVLPTQFDKTSEGLVPKLFDDYVLAAVQNAGDFEVIGQDDIGSILGFEKQKEILGCDDASCLADIGGALGVDKIVAVKIARLEDEWVVTSKLINIRETRVEARTSDMVTGNVKVLLTAVPDIVGKLFGIAPPVVTKPATANKSLAAAVTTRPDGQKRDEKLGRGARVAGMILAISGVSMTAFGMLYGGLLSSLGSSSSSDPYSADTNDTFDTAAKVMIIMFGGGGGLMTGIGSGLYMNGKARAFTADERATGSIWYRWIGWTLLGLGSVLPIVAGDSSAGTWGAVLGLGGSAVVFGMSMFTSSATAYTTDGHSVPFATFILVPDREQHLAPGFALSYSF